MLFALIKTRSRRCKTYYWEFHAFENHSNESVFILNNLRWQKQIKPMFFQKPDSELSWIKLDNIPKKPKPQIVLPESLSKSNRNETRIICNCEDIFFRSGSLEIDTDLHWEKKLNIDPYIIIMKIKDFQNQWAKGNTYSNIYPLIKDFDNPNLWKLQEKNQQVFENLISKQNDSCPVCRNSISHDSKCRICHCTNCNADFRV